HRRRGARARRRKDDAVRRVPRLDHGPRQRGLHADGNRLRSRPARPSGVRRRRGRGRRGLVPRLLYTREGGGARPARRCGHRLTRGARRRHHCRARARALGRAPLVDPAPRLHGLDHRGPEGPARPQATDGGQPVSESTGNGRERQQEKVRVAIIGVGNCANSFMQGLTYYKDAKPEEFVPGLMHVDLGGYHISDVEVVAAFDVVKGKVGVDLADANWAHPNDTIKFADVAKTGITVNRGMTLDGIGKYLSEIVEKDDRPTDDIVGILRDRDVDVVVNYLPVGSEDAVRWYAEQVMAAGCAMVNCMPVFIAREDYWNKRFRDAGVPIIGDDIKSQVGATITHRVLTSLFRERGVHLDKTMQLNVGGNSDFLNMLERDRLESKKISKTNAVTSMLDYDLGAKNVHVGPSDYVPWLT